LIPAGTGLMASKYRKIANLEKRAEEVAAIEAREEENSEIG
jgi:hypothetical protein